MNSTNNYIIQRQNNPGDAEILSSVIGTQKSADYTIQIGQGGSTGLGTVRRTHEYMVHPDELKRLGMGEAIIVNKQTFAVNSVMVRQSAVYGVYCQKCVKNGSRMPQTHR
ncbi:MAG: hypothetical protein ACE5EH_06405 [Gammaproteobacteria bacterium]